MEALNLIEPLTSALVQVPLYPLILLLVALLFSVQPLHGQDPKYYEIAAGDAKDTLQEFARISGEQILYLVSRVEGYQTSAIKGSYSSKEALERMLGESGLNYIVDEETHAFMIRVINKQSEQVNSAKEVSPPDAVTTKPKIEKEMTVRKSTLRRVLLAFGLLGGVTASTVAQDADGDVLIFDPFVVDTSSDTGVVGTQATTGSLIAMDIKDSPFSINVINAELIETLQLSNWEEIGRYSSVNTSNTQATGNNIAFARGFQMQNLINGYAPGGRTFVTANVERVEVLKGPNSVLYGLANPGGGINYITKKPLFYSQNKLTLTLGSYDLYRALFDSTGAIVEDKLAYRVVASFQDAGGDRDHESDEYTVFAPSITFRPIDTLSITASYEYLDRIWNRLVGVPAPTINGQSVYRPNEFGFDRDGYNPNGPDAIFENEQHAYNIDVKFTPTDFLAFRYQYNATERHNPITQGLWGTTSGNYRAQINDASNDVDGHIADMLLSWELSDWGINGDFLVGLETNSNYFETPIYRFTQSQTPIFGSENPGGRGPLFLDTEFSSRFDIPTDRIRIFDTSVPQSGGNYPLATREDLLQPENLRQINGQTTNEFTNLRFLHTLRAFDDRLTVVTGYSFAEAKTISPTGPRDPVTLRSADTVTREQEDEPYQVGIGYNFFNNNDVIDYLTVYGQTATSFRNQFGLDAFFNPIDPVRGTIDEVGLKFSSHKGKFSGWVALFNMTNSNLIKRLPLEDVDDPNTPADETSDAITAASGKEESEGIDFFLSYQPTDDWFFSLEGTFFDGEVVSDVQTPAREGLELQRAPEESLVFIGSHDIGNFTAGVAVTYVSDAIALNNNIRNSTRRTDERTLVDLFFSYDSTIRDLPITYNLKIDNITNEENYIDFNGSWGEPINARLSATITF